MLGPTVVRAHGATLTLRPRERDVLAALAVGGPRPASTSVIIDLLWPVSPPPTAKQALQNHIARLRRSLGADAILTDDGSYRLGPAWSLDIDQFVADVDRARRGTLKGEHAIALVFLRKALSSIRGAPFADLPESAAVAAERARLDQLRMTAEDELLLALLASRDFTTAIGEASSSVMREPYREARWMALALALYHDGQRRESLQALQRGREALRDTSGLEGGPSVSRLESLILNDDPILGLASPASLIGHNSVAAAAAAPADVFVGRTALLEEIRKLLVRAFDDRGGLSLEVIGEEGVGKTALAERVAAQAAVDGWHVATVTCSRTQSRPLEPLGDLIRQAVDLEPNPADAFHPSLLADVATLWGAELHGSARGDLGEAIVEVLTQHAQRFPTLVLVDDAHHLSPTAARLLRRVGASAVPLVVIYLRRPAPGAERLGAVAAELEGLDADETARLLERLAGAAVTPELAAATHAATGGNPLLVRVASDEAVLTVDGQGTSRRTGGGIFLSALDRMSSTARMVGSVLAVAGGPMARDTILAAMPDGSGQAAQLALAEGVDGGVFRADAEDRIDLSSAVLRDALIAALDEDARLDVHERVGSALLATGGNVLAAAPHLIAASARSPMRGIDVAGAAAQVATNATMFVEAAELLAAAAGLAELHLGPADRRTLVLLLDQAEARRRAGDRSSVDLVWDVVRRAESVADAETFALGAAALCRLGPLTEAGTLNPDVADVVERALAGTQDPVLRALCAGEATLFYSMSGRVDLCRAHFDDALTNARLTGDDRVLVGVLGSAYPSLSHPDDWQLRADLAPEMLALAERLDDDDARFQALHLYFSIQVQFSDPLLRTTFARQAELAATLRSAGRRWMAGYQRACLAYLDGRLDDALAIGAEMFEQAPVARSRASAGYWMNLLMVRLAQGRGEELAPEIDRVIEEQPGLPAWRGVAAWLAALRGDADRVRHECDALSCGRSLPRDMPWSGAVMLLGRAVAAIGDVDRSTAVAELIAPYSGLMTWFGSSTVGPFDLALAELALARGQHGEARRYVTGARVSIDRLNAHVFRSDLERVASLLPSG